MNVVYETHAHFPHTESLPFQLQQQYLWLRKKAHQEANVIDAKTGYISIPCMNKQPLNYQALEAQAEILAHFLDRAPFPTRIIGIPTSGLPLAERVAEKIPTAQLKQAIKLDDGYQPYWPNSVQFNAYSFTKGMYMPMCMEPVEPGQNYLVIDDVSAHGNVASAFIQEIQNRGGIVVGFGVGFDKGFQGGLLRVLRERHVTVASVLTIKDITRDGRGIILE